jgi:hypothetical protein
MADQTTIGQRFTELISHLGISKNAFANSLDKTATVVQHLVEERNKPGYDLLCKVFEVYPNVSKDWLLLGAGPMLVSELGPPTMVPQVAEAVAPASASATETAPKTARVNTAATAQADTEPPLGSSITAASTSAPAVSAAEPASAVPVPVAAPEPVASVVPAPVVAAAMVAPAAPVPNSGPAVPPDTAWQTALYTQQMAHQLAMAELRNQHLQEQQRLMQQMLDLMQRKL